MATRIIGERMHRVDATDKVTGDALYPGDLEMAEMLHAKILFSEKPHARIVSIDTSQAEALDGVKRIFTASDIPNNEYGLIMFDQPVLCGPGSSKEGTDIVRTTMDQIALIVAETEEIAAKARNLINVEYQDLPTVYDVHEAMKDGAPQLHADKPNNIVTHYRVRHGDIEEGFAQADVVIEGTYTTSWQEHAYLQPEAGLAYIDEEDRVTIEVAGQWTHEDQEQICHALNLPPEKVRVIYPAIGGAFGGREDMSIQIVLALATLTLRQPVKIIWSREESIKGHHKRHPYYIKHRLGAKNDGTLVAAEVEVISDSGAYAYTSTKVLGNATMMCIGPYNVPNANVDAYTVYTNNIPCGAFRGFGGPQAAFAAESQMNKLADKLGMDPVDLRMKNVLQKDDVTHVGTPMPGNLTMAQVIAACAEHGGWQQTDTAWRRDKSLQPADTTKRRGVGFACGFKNIGFSFGAPEACDARIELRGKAEVEEVILYHAGAEVGQGAHTVFTQMTADAVGEPVEKVKLIASDTATSGNSGSVSASRMTFMAGNAIRGAGQKALEAWRHEDRPAVGEHTYHPPKTTMFDPETGYCTPNFAYGYVAQIVEVEVDVETGLIEVLNVVCADDVGKAINPDQVEGQIEGGVVQAHGYALLENFQMKDGQVLTPFLNNYLIPGVLDIPQTIKPVILELAEDEGPWGARGMAEMPFIPYAPAVSAAFYDATGVWIDDIPLVPDRVISHLRQAGIGG